MVMVIEAFLSRQPSSSQKVLKTASVQLSES